MAVIGGVYRVWGSTSGSIGVVTRVWGNGVGTAKGAVFRVWGSIRGAFNIDTTADWTVDGGDWVPLHAIEVGDLTAETLSWSQILSPGQTAWEVISGAGTPDMVIEAPGTKLGTVGTFRATGTKTGYPNATVDVLVTVNPDRGLVRATSTGWRPLFLGDADDPSHPLLEIP